MTTRKPNLGVFTSKPKSRITRSRYKHISERGAEQGLNVYLFSPRDVHEDHVRGYVFEDGEWKAYDCPLPDVVYDRIFTKRPDQAKQAKDTRNYLRSLNAVFINDPAVAVYCRDKLKFAQTMEEHDVNHPETVKYTERNATKMSKKHRTAYFKPRTGSAGTGIIIARQIGRNRYSLSYKKNENREWVSKRIQAPGSELPNAVDFIRHDELGLRDRYIVQEGLDLLKYDDSQTDFRIVTMRNGDNEQKIAGCFSRVDGNFHQGGKILDFKEVTDGLNGGSQQNGRRMRRKIRRGAIKAVGALENITDDGSIGEAGIDLVVEKSGDEYVIEGNSKPGPMFLDIARLYPDTAIARKAKRQRRRAADSLVGYALYLAA
ncbi:YheC/YheD family protein [Candidatus Aenigmatarchaeota archaeon]